MWHQLLPISLPTPVLALATGPDGVWAGGHGGVAWYAAGRWHPQIAGLPLTSVAALSYAGGWLLAGGANGIARSRDGGRTWQPARVPGTPGAVSALVASPRFAEDTTVLAATLGGGVLRSDDAGAHWRPANFGLQTGEITALAWSRGETVLAATTDGIYRSPNAGRAWRGCPESEGLPIAALVTLPDGTALAATEAGDLLRSTDDGRTWAPHGALPAGVQITALLATLDAVLLGSLDRGILRSSDGGASWQAVAAGAVLALAAGHDICYAGTDSGMLVGANRGTTWAAAPHPPLHDLRKLLIGDTLLVYGVHSTPLCLRAGGRWVPLHNVPLPLTGIAVGPDGALLAASPAGLARSTDGGQSWSTVVDGETGCMAHITFRSDGSGWAASSDSTRLLRTRDGGRSWESLAAPFGVLPLAALLATADAVIAATYDPRRQVAQLWRSTDDGTTWARGAEIATDWPIVATHHCPALLTLGSYAFAERAAGNWERVALGGGVRRVVGRGRALLALTTVGLLRSMDGGTTWARDDAGLPIEQVMDIALDEGGLYALLAGGQVVRRIAV